MPAAARCGSASARSLLLTVLGEFVHPRHASVWTATLLEALGALGVEEKSARQALTRTAAEGLLDLHPARPPGAVGADPARRATLLEEGTRRIYGFMRERHPWDGRWLVLSVPIPETQRQLRHRLRTRLTWLGLGSPTSGLWVTPDATKADDGARRGPRPRPRGAGVRVGRARPAASATRAGCSPTPGTSPTSRTATSAFLAEFEARARRTRPRTRSSRRSRWSRSGGASRSSTRTCPRELLDHDWPGPARRRRVPRPARPLAPPRRRPSGTGWTGRRPAGLTLDGLLTDAVSVNVS